MTGIEFAFASANDFGIPFDRSSTMSRLEKSTPRRSRPIGGIRMPSTSVLTILTNAAPIMIPIARSTTLPRAMNVLNSFHIDSIGRGRAPDGRLAEVVQLPDYFMPFVRMSFRRDRRVGRRVEGEETGANRGGEARIL